MEEYAAGELAARVQAAGPGQLAVVGRVLAISDGLVAAGAGGSAAEMERLLEAQVRELGRMLYQLGLDAGAAAEPRLAGVTGADGVRRGVAVRGRGRALVTAFGRVRVTRIAYRARGAGSLHPRDARLDLPLRVYSWPLQRTALEYVLAGSYEQARRFVAGVTGVTVGTRQLEQVTVEAARDAPGFYARDRGGDQAGGGDGLAGVPLVISADGKGVAMRPEARRCGARGPRPAGAQL